METPSDSVRYIAEHIHEIASSSNEPTSITKQAGEVLFAEGDKGKFMYVITAGSVDIISGGVLLERVGRWGTIGELALIDDAPRSANAVVHEAAILIPISRWRFKQLVKMTPDFSLYVMSVLNRRLREMNTRLAKAG